MLHLILSNLYKNRQAVDIRDQSTCLVQLLARKCAFKVYFKTLKSHAFFIYGVRMCDQMIRFASVSINATIIIFLILIMFVTA